MSLWLPFTIMLCVIGMFTRQSIFEGIVVGLRAGLIILPFWFVFTVVF